MRAGIEFNQRLENLGVDFLGGFVRANVLRSQLLADAHHVSPELLLAESIGCDVGSLADTHFADVRLIDINANSQRLAVADR